MIRTMLLKIPIRVLCKTVLYAFLVCFRIFACLLSCLVLSRSLWIIRVGMGKKFPTSLERWKNHEKTHKDASKQASKQTSVYL